MAKITLSKITPVKKIDNKTIEIEGQEITILQYLPIAEKSKLIETVLDAAVDSTGFCSPIRLEVLFHIEVIRSYTNISITDKMMEDPGKLYDLLIMNNILDAVLSNIPEDEYDTLFEAVESCANQVAEYTNSFMGVLKATQSDFNVTSESIDNMMSTLHDPEAIGLVQDVLQKLG